MTPFFSQLFQRRKLYYEGPSIFVYLLSDSFDDIAPGTVVVLDTNAGDWISLSPQRSAASLPEKRQIRGTLSQLEVFLQGLRNGDPKVADAILAYTRGCAVMQEASERPCDWCVKRKWHWFDRCIVLTGISGFPEACASCIMIGRRYLCSNLCLLSDEEEEGANMSEYVDSDAEEISPQGAGTKDDPIDLTGEDVHEVLRRSLRLQGEK